MGFANTARFKWISIFAIAVVAFVTYQPALKIGFLDGWWYLEWVSTLDLPRYLIQFFDPHNVTQGYRPVQGLYVLAQYSLFRFNPDGYHLTHIFLHAANSILLFAIVGRLGKNWRLALSAALFYVASPVFALAIFWHAVVDPLSSFFYLLTLLLWLSYLEKRHPASWIAAFVTYVLALFSKETSFSLPVILFLIDWWFYGNRPELERMVRQYAAFLFMLFLYFLWESNVQSHGEFTSQFGFQIGPQMLVNLLPYLAVLTFPVFTEKPTQMILYIWLAVSVVAYALVTVTHHSKTMLILAILAILSIAPLTGFPQEYYNTRYLYMPMVATSVVVAMILEAGWRIPHRRRIYSLIAGLFVTLIIISGSARVLEAAASLAEYTAELSAPFREISREHPVFPEDSYLYFVYPSKTPLVDLQGLFLAGYGPKLLVSGTEDVIPSSFRSHQNVFVFYFDDADRPHEIVVDRNAQTGASVTLPADFDIPIRLESIEIVNPIVRRGDPLIAILSWRALGLVDKNYTFFVHLVDQYNHEIAGYESAPRRGTEPMGQFKVGVPVLDAVILPVAQAPVGSNYRLEIGLSDPVTTQSLMILDAHGRIIGDRVSIDPIEIR